MKPWNQAAWKQNTYRKRAKVKAVGDESLNRGGVDTVCCKRCGYYVHDASCPGHADYVSPAPHGWAVAETSVEQDESPSLTLAQVAWLPVGTKVVVDCGEGAMTTGMVFALCADWTSHRIPQVLLCEVNGAPWTVTLDCATRRTFKVVR